MAEMRNGMGRVIYCNSRKKGMISDEEWEVYKEKVLKSPDYPFA